MFRVVLQMVESEEKVLESFGKFYEELNARRSFINLLEGSTKDWMI